MTPLARRATISSNQRLLNQIRTEFTSLRADLGIDVGRECKPDPSLVRAGNSETSTRSADTAPVSVQSLSSEHSHTPPAVSGKLVPARTVRTKPVRTVGRRGRMSEDDTDDLNDTSLQAVVTTVPPEATPRIVRLSDVLSLEMQTLPLSGRFADFLKQLPSKFKMVIWGPAGGGKSTFMVDFSDELSRFGRVLYQGAEEAPEAGGWRSRIVIVGARSDTVDILDSDRLSDLQGVLRADRLRTTYFDGITSPADAKRRFNQLAMKHHPDRGGDRATFEDVEREYRAISSARTFTVNPSRYRFVVIDSINQVGFDYRTIVSLEQEFPDISWILIVHAVKGGRMLKGASDWEHWADVVIRVNDGIASTDPRKNRFGAPAEFAIFPKRR